MPETEAARLAHQAASRAHVAKNALRADVGLTNLAAALERLSQAVAILADEHQVNGVADLAGKLDYAGVDKAPAAEEPAPA